MTLTSQHFARNNALIFKGGMTMGYGGKQLVQDGIRPEGLSERWREASPDRIITEALELFPDLMMTSGFNLNGIVLIDKVAKLGYRGKVVFVDTGYHFQETLDLKDELELRYPELEFVTLRPNLPDDREYARDPDSCCFRRKVKPLKDYLAKHQPSALFSGRNQDGALTRQDLQAFEDGEPAKINPLFQQSTENLLAYVEENNLTMNPLFEKGYLSIGCAPCTRPVRAGEHIRAGRWDGQEKTECGLWWGDNAL